MAFGKASMLKARSGDNILLGLSARSIELLMAGNPVLIDLRAIGFEKGKIAIVYGQTEEAIKQELIANGVVMPHDS